MEKELRPGKFISIVNLLTATVILLIFSAFQLPQKQDQGFLIWQNVPLKIKAAGFYIAGVIDERADKKIIARLIPAAAPANKNTAEALTLQGGGLVAVEEYLKHNLPYQDSCRPVIMRVKKLLINEMALPNGGIDGKVELSIAFGLKTGEDMEAHLVNYTGGAHYIRTPAQTCIAEPALRNAIENALVYFNSWMGKQADDNPLLAKTVKLIFSDYRDEQPEADTVYYAANRPLTWADFKGRPDNSRFDAEVIPGLGFTEKVSVNKGIINVAIATKVYIPKSAAWVKPGRMDDYALNHEQRHFEITKLVSEMFKKTLLGQKLPVLNYDGTINVAYFEALRNLNRMQKQYDDETNHGSNQQAQARWNSYIDKELAAFKN